MGKKPKIFVCPLDWGIGHATRCVPVVQTLLHKGAEVILGASGRSLAFLEKEFPELSIIEFKGVDITYPEKGNRMPIHMLLRSPILLKGIRQENRMLSDFIKKHQFTGIISDNRYGLHSNNVPSVLITHQIFIQSSRPLKLLEPVLTHQVNTYIRKFDFCWIPDFENEMNLSGDLSHKRSLPSNCRYIGALSRFAVLADEPDPDKKEGPQYDVLFLLSGPEPQRTLLEQKINEELRGTELKVAMVLGKPEEQKKYQNQDQIDRFPHLDTPSLFRLLNNSDLVVTRPGYSTIMDLAVTGNRAVLIPTPGQTEQEYLGRRLEKNGIYLCIPQKEFNLQKAVAMIGKYTGIQHQFSNNKLENSVHEFLDRI